MEHEHCWHPRNNFHLALSGLGRQRWMECCTFECDETRSQTAEERDAAIVAEQELDALLRQVRYTTEPTAGGE